jgi:drug/metabolite transporter (DMT)-like permease
VFNLAWYDFVGFAGVLMVVGAYAGQQTRRLSGDGIAYSLLNALGAAGILVPVWYAETMNWSVLFIETVWIAISLYGMRTALTRKRPAVVAPPVEPRP